MTLRTLLGLLLMATGCSSTTPGQQANPGPQGRATAPSATPAAHEGPRATAAAPGTASVIPYEVHRATLDNGLRVIVIPMPSDGLVSYWTVVRTGSRDEVEKGVTGFAHFFEHMMFRGSEKFPAKVYDEIVKGLGADANAFTNDDFTAYHMSFSKDDLPRVVEIEADRFQNLKYGEAEFKTEAGAVYGEYRKGRTSPFEVLFEALQNAAFDKHTYKHTTIGFEADIQAMPQQFEYSKGFFKRFYRPENVIVVVTGDVNPANVFALVKQRYAGWAKGYQAPAIEAEPPQTAQRRIDVPFDGETLPMLTVAFKGEKFIPTDRTMVAATLVGDLAFGETSPLYKKLVLDEQRVDRIFNDFGYKRDPGLWAVIASVKDANDVSAVEGEIWSALDELRTKPVSAQRLADVRSRTKYGFLTGLSTPNGVSESLAPIVALSGDVAAIDHAFASLDAVTPEDVQRAVELYLTPARSTVAVLHAKSAPPLRDAAAGAGEKPVLMPVPQDPNVAFNLWFKVGSQDDPPGKEGLAALTGAMLSDGGTKKLSYDQILERLFPIAGNYTVRVDKEMTVASGLVHRDNVGPFYALFTDAILSPGFRVEDFERLRDQAVTGIEKDLRYSSDEELGKATLTSRVYAGTPYAHLTDGAVKSLKSITLDDVKAFYAKHFTRDNVVVGLGGAYPPTLPSRLQADLGRLAEGKPPAAPAPAPAAFTGRHVTIVEKPGPSTAISFGVPIDVRRGSREFYALWIANSWLGEHRNSASHLYQVIREARGMNYGDYSYIEAFPRGGQRSMPPTGVGRRAQMFEVWVRPVPEDRALFALRAALREVDDLAKKGMSKEEFESTRAFLKKYALHFAETTADRLGYAVDDRYYGIDGHLATFRKRMDEITLDEVNAAVKKYLQADNLQIAIVTAHAEKLRDAIVTDAPSPIDYGAVPKPKEILEEDKLIERYPLRVPAANVTIVPVDSMFAE